jgi:hypothetical protein
MWFFARTQPRVTKIESALRAIRVPDREAKGGRHWLAAARMAEFSLSFALPFTARREWCS